MNWETFFTLVSESFKDLCVGSFSSYKGAATKDMQTFLEKSKLNLENWSQQLIEGKLSKDNYESLIKRQMAMAEFIAIKQSGIGKIELEKLSSGLAKIVVNTAFRLIF